MITPVIMPRQGQSVETCIITEWHKRKGDSVHKGEILVSYETDKASFDLESPASGTLLEIFFNNGDEVRVLANIAVIGQPGESTDEYKPDRHFTNDITEKSNEIKVAGSITDQKNINSEIMTSSPVYDKLRISPRAKILAERLNVPISKIRGTGPGGRITEKDIEKAASEVRTTKLASEIIEKENKSTGVSPTGIGERFRSTDLVDWPFGASESFIINKISNIRRIIAGKMFASLQNSAQLTHHTSADARKILEKRKIFKSDPEKSKGIDITINDMVCFAVIKALKNKPEINSHFLGDSIKTFNQVHLGVAVDTERGLMVPVLRNAGNMSLSELSSHIKALAEQCRKGSINPELLASTSASFTVTNLGSYGIEMFTPVLNLPQTGILGVNTIVYRPADLGNGEIGIIPVIGLSLTYDHRAMDGGPASIFLKEVRDQIEAFDMEMV